MKLEPIDRLALFFLLALLTFLVWRAVSPPPTDHTLTIRFDLGKKETPPPPSPATPSHVPIIIIPDAPARQPL